MGFRNELEMGIDIEVSRDSIKILILEINSSKLAQMSVIEVWI